MGILSNFLGAVGKWISGSLGNEDVAPPTSTFHDSLRICRNVVGDQSTHHGDDTGAAADSSTASGRTTPESGGSSPESGRSSPASLSTVSSMGDSILLLLLLLL